MKFTVGVRIRSIKVLLPKTGMNKVISRIIIPYRSKVSCHFTEESIGRRLRKIFEPSSGGIGRRLKIAKIIFIWIRVKIKDKIIKFCGITLVSKLAKMARMRLLDGPARAIISSSRRGCRRL